MLHNTEHYKKFLHDSISNTNILDKKQRAQKIIEYISSAYKHAIYDYRKINDQTDSFVNRIIENHINCIEDISKLATKKFESLKEINPGLVHLLDTGSYQKRNPNGSIDVFIEGACMF